MNKTFQYYQIDLSSNNNFTQYNTIQGDGNDIRGFEVELIENNKPYIISDDVEVFIAGTKPDTKHIFNSCEITEDRKIFVNVTSQMSAITGRGDYQIVLISKTNNQQLKSFPFIIYVKKAAFDAEIITSSNEFQALTCMVNKIDSTLNKTDLVDNMLESSSKILEDTTAAYENAVNSLEKAQEAIDTAESINSTAQEYADYAKQSEENSALYSNMAKSYAVGTNNEIRENDAADNAKYYKEQAKLSSDSALQSANLAGQKSDAASLSESNSQQYALSAANSETNAKISEDNAKNSESNALKSSSDAMQSAVNSENSAAKSAQSAEKALESATNANASELSAKNYADNAAESANRAEQVSLVSIATLENAGIVKPDGTTITVDEDGTLHGANTIETDGQSIEKTTDNVLKIADTLMNLIYNAVQQIPGKGLSANDFTNALLNKLNGIENGAQLNPVPTNNLLATVPGNPLDAVQGKELRNQISNAISTFEEWAADLRDMDDDLVSQIENVSDSILNKVYPVGSVYISFNNNSPANFIGGTWERLVNRFLYAATNDIGGTGGEATHMLTTDELPSHSHDIPELKGKTNKTGGHSHKYGSSRDLASPGSNHGTAFQASGYDTSTSGEHEHTVSISSSSTYSIGENKAHNNMPPYINVYMWKRTA